MSGTARRRDRRRRRLGDGRRQGCRARRGEHDGAPAPRPRARRTPGAAARAGCGTGDRCRRRPAAARREKPVASDRRGAPSTAASTTAAPSGGAAGRAAGARSPRARARGRCERLLAVGDDDPERPVASSASSARPSARSTAASGPAGLRELGGTGCPQAAAERHGRGRARHGLHAATLRAPGVTGPCRSVTEASQLRQHRDQRVLPREHLARVGLVVVTEQVQQPVHDQRAHLGAASRRPPRPPAARPARSTPRRRRAGAPGPAAARRRRRAGTRARR